MERARENMIACVCFVRGMSEPLHFFVCLFVLFILFLRKCFLNTLPGGARHFYYL